jgi:D-tyrosyl-tRNA(Tyr) deacylase
VVEGLMRAVVQRVLAASVEVDGDPIGQIGSGLLVLLGVGPGDGPKETRWMAEKIAGLRIFRDAQGRMNLSALDLGYAILVVSQFTLYGDCRKGRRPNFLGAASPEHAEPIYEAFCEALTAAGVGTVERGRFGAMMEVSLRNDGPVTLVIESPD